MKYIRNWGKFYPQSEEWQPVEIQKLIIAEIFSGKTFLKSTEFYERLLQSSD